MKIVQLQKISIPPRISNNVRKKPRKVSYTIVSRVLSFMISSLPSRLLSDQGREFVAKVNDKVCQEFQLSTLRFILCLVGIQIHPRRYKCTVLT